MSEKYDHIIGLPHHVSKKHPQMSNYDRAAQFSSFKALTGFADEIDESARYVEKRKPLTEMQQDALNKTFQKLEELDLPLITVTYFVADEKKTGGVYMKYTGHFRILDMGDRKMKFTEGMAISLDSVEDVRILENDNIY